MLHKGNLRLNEIDNYINYFALQKAKFGIKNVLSYRDNCPRENLNRSAATKMVYNDMNSPTEVLCAF